MKICLNIPNSLSGNEERRCLNLTYRYVSLLGILLVVQRICCGSQWVAASRIIVKMIILDAEDSPKIMSEGLERVIFSLPIRATTSAKDIILRRRNTLIQVEKYSFCWSDAPLQHFAHLHSILVTNHSRRQSSYALGLGLPFQGILSSLKLWLLFVTYQG